MNSEGRYALRQLYSGLGLREKPFIGLDSGYLFFLNSLAVRFDGEYFHGFDFVLAADSEAFELKMGALNFICFQVAKSLFVSNLNEFSVFVLKIL